MANTEVFTERNPVDKKEKRNVNPVTNLPALRETISWFKSISEEVKIENFLSVSIFEMHKYISILENDGIAVVDKMIIFIAELLKSIWKDEGYIAHIFGDKFGIISICSATESEEIIVNELKKKIDTMLNAVEEYNNQTDSFTIELDYGYIVAQPGWSGSFESYLKLCNSEILLNRLKKEFSLSNSSRSIVWKHQEVFNLLIEKNMFHYHFQPIVNAQDGAIFGYEALMRTHPLINMRPLEVIDVATSLGKLYNIEWATMSNTLEYVSRNNELFEDKKIFVNSIPAHMLTVADWNKLVSKYSKLMDKLVVEMTEQSEMEADELCKFRNRLKERNISLAIDDYGTGFSNLSNLIRYNPDFVKIDRTLVQNIQEKPKIQRLVSGIIEFIHENGYSALAEGVETREELKTMIDLGIDFIQGYYIAKPQAELLTEVDKVYRDEIVAFNIMRSEFVVKVYTPGENEVVNLSQLAMRHYNSIVIDKENVVIEGVEGTSYSCNIVVKDGTKTNITLRNVNITTKKELPLIDIGVNCNVIMKLEGTNEIINRGIRVPQDAELFMKGEGSLHIYCEMVNSYAIGGDIDSTFGNIHIEHLSKLTIDTNGENCIGIGGGHNSANSKININSSNIHMACAGGKSVGMGCFNGNIDIEIQKSALELNMSCANAVAIGALRGYTNIIADDCSINIIECGNNLRGIGTIENGEGSIAISNGTIACDLRGRNIVCVGTANGALDCIVTKTDTTFYCEGNSVVGIGDMKGSGSVKIREANLSMRMLAKDIKDIGCEDTKLEIVESKRNIKMNE